MADKFAEIDGIKDVPVKQYRTQDGIAYFAPLTPEEEERLHKVWLNEAKDDFYLFVRGIQVATEGGSRCFENVMATFQRDVFTQMKPSIRQLRDGLMPFWRRWWIERTKKASKDADLALMVIWLVAFATRPFYGQIGAANKEQASIVKKRIEHLLFWNKWLNEYMEVVQWKIKSRAKMEDGRTPLCEFDIMSSDIAGAHGGTPDLLIVNELSHVTKWEFAENLMDNADGVPQGMIVIATNAGFKGTKAEVWRNNAIKSPMWAVHVLDRPAPWHDKKTVEDARARTTLSRWKRLWQGVWVSGKGDALSEEAIERLFRMLGPKEGPEEGIRYIAGLDLGITHDHSALVILGVNILQRSVFTALWKKWVPRNTTGKVALPEVMAEVKRLAKLFRVECVWYDPTEARLMAQLLGEQVKMEEMSFSKPGNLNLMAECLIQASESASLVCYDDEEGTLRRDFGKFDIVEKPYGYKLEAVRDEFGHADVGTALVIALPAALKMLDVFHGLQEDDELFVADNDIEEFEQKIKNPDIPKQTIHDALKDLYNSVEDDYIDPKKIPVIGRDV